VLGSTYFQGFGGGRTVDWADGASRIRDSHLVESLSELEPHLPASLEGKA